MFADKEPVGISQAFKLGQTVPKKWGRQPRLWNWILYKWLGVPRHRLIWLPRGSPTCCKGRSEPPCYSFCPPTTHSLKQGKNSRPCFQPNTGIMSKKTRNGYRKQPWFSQRSRRVGGRRCSTKSFCASLQTLFFLPNLVYCKCKCKHCWFGSYWFSLQKKTPRTNTKNKSQHGEFALRFFQLLTLPPHHAVQVLLCKVKSSLCTCQILRVMGIQVSINWARTWP